MPIRLLGPGVRSMLAEGKEKIAVRSRRGRKRVDENPDNIVRSDNHADTDVDKLIERRSDTRQWWEHPDACRKPDNLVGLALSGGGIRSATFSLGVIQSLARSGRDALAQVDILSTVSGGGYIGCFLRSLFMPNEGRGIEPRARTGGDLPRDSIADQYLFARNVLSSAADNHNIEWLPAGVKRRNPLWWLREHSRYLAPNGPTDYGYAAAYIARNWVAMIYIFLVASLACFSLMIGIEVAAKLAWPQIFCWTWTSSRGTACATGPLAKGIPLSPAIVLAVPPIILSAVASIAYWMTQAMSPNEADDKRQWTNLALAAGATVVVAVAAIAASNVIAPGALNPAVLVNRIPAGSLFVWLLTLTLVLTVLGTLVALIGAMVIARRPGSLAGNLRSMLTNLLASSNRWAVIFLVLALIDGVGAWLAHPLEGVGRAKASLFAGALPALAYVIKKLPDWFGGPGKGTIFSLLQRSMSTVALLAGLLLFGAVAIIASALVHANAWSLEAWVSDPDWPRFALFMIVILLFAALAGTADGFINLSSLHSFYAARLTRAYLGASNNKRLEAVAAGPQDAADRHVNDPASAPPGERRSFRVTETDPADYIQPELYCSADLPAPVHIINATINETIDPQSQLVARDRKGDVFSLEPHGIRVGEEFVPWGRIGKKEAEQLSLGQWCAISGAAASSGMGRLTSLGFALAFTFANVRLGYWWWSPGVCEKSRVRPGFITGRFAKWFGTYVYLANEMTARYSRGYTRKYLTDGGHFENSGAYRLLQHKVPLIIVCDNGADEHYRFQDLENLVRSARLDFGAEVELLGGEELRAFLGTIGGLSATAFADCEETPDWRAQFADPGTEVFALALRARFDEEALHLIWLKPRTLADLPPDLLGYWNDNPTFPQQSTGDQFFDEAQWESYRKLGEIMMRRLLDQCPSLLSAAVPKKIDAEGADRAEAGASPQVA